MISIRDLLTYYADDDLTFNQIMDLYLDDTLKLEGGELSKDDLNRLYRECNLEPIDSRGLNQGDVLKGANGNHAHDSNPPDISELEKLCQKLENDCHHMEQQSQGHRGRRRKRRRRQIVVPDPTGYAKTLIELASTYEQLYESDKNTHHLEKAIMRRECADKIIGTESGIAKMKIAADNLMRLGESAATIGVTTKYGCFERALTKYDVILNNIRNEESRNRAEENAKKAQAHMLLYRKEREPKHLFKAKEIMDSYSPFDTKGKYTWLTLEIMRLEGEYLEGKKK